MRWTKAMMALVPVACALFVACASSDRRPARTSGQSDVAGGSSCAVVEGRNEPFIVDWRADRRIDIEAALTRSIVVVSYECQRMRILTDCSAEGAYRYVGVTRREELLRIESTDELHANLPLGDNAIAKNLGAAIAHGSTVDIALAVIGKKSSSRPWLLKGDLKGACAGATHFVRGVTLGAFALTSGTRDRAQSPIDILGPQASGVPQPVIHNRDGEIGACREAAADSEAPPRQCSTPLRLELTPLRSRPPTATEGANEIEAVQRCPRALVLDDTGLCVTRSSRPHVCRPEDTSACAAQCERGSFGSCSVLGRANMLGRGMPRDGSKARALLEPACKHGLAQACGYLGELAITEQKLEEGATHLDDACMAGWFPSCETRAELAMRQEGPAKSNAFPLFQRACRAGDPDGCWGVGTLFGLGVGVRTNEREGLRWLREACATGAKLGCASLAKLLDEGAGGGDPDPMAAIGILQPSCDLGYSHACSALSAFYFAGRGVATDAGKGMELLTRACEGTDPTSCSAAAMRYASGKGTSKDEAKARKYYARACESGDDAACKVAKP